MSRDGSCIAKIHLKDVAIELFRFTTISPIDDNTDVSGSAFLLFNPMSSL